MSYYHVYAPLSHQAFKMLGAVIGRVKRPSVNRGFLYGPLLATPGVGVTGITCGTWSMKPKVCDGPIESEKSWAHRSPCAFATPSKQMSCHITKIYAFPKELLFIYYGANVMILSGQCSRIFPHVHCMWSRFIPYRLCQVSSLATQFAAWALASERAHGAQLRDIWSYRNHSNPRIWFLSSSGKFDAWEQHRKIQCTDDFTQPFGNIKPW